MDQEAITRYIADTFPGVDVERASAENGAPEIAWGDTFFIYDPNRTLEGARRFPFATIVVKDYGDFDNACNLDRPGVFRLNVGVSRERFLSLFEAEAKHDFTAQDLVMPHPVYASNHFICVLNPSDETFEAVKPLLADAYELAVKRFERGSRSR